jgi:heat shock protein HslJ
VDDLAGAAFVDGTQVTMEFNDQGQVSGSAGCNRYTGTYQRSGDLLSFGPVAATRMACAPPILDQEMAFLGLLESGVRYEWTSDDRLILHPADGSTPSTLSLLIGGR